MPSSDQRLSISAAFSARRRAATAIDHGACTRAPNGDSTQTRQSPTSSRKRSTTIAAIARRFSGRCRLVVEVVDQILRSAPVEVMFVDQPGFALGPRQREQLASELADRPTERRRSPGAVAAARTASFPALRAPGDTVTRSWVICSIRHDEAPSKNTSPVRDSNTISSSSSPTRIERSSVVRLEENSVEAAIGDRAAAGHRDVARALASLQRAPNAIPGHPRPQLGELVARIASAQHVEHAVERAAAELGERRGLAHERVGLLDVERRRPTPSRPAAEPARRADYADRRSLRLRPRSCAWSTRRRPADRRGAWERSRRSTPDRRCARCARCAGAPKRSTAAPRSESPDQPRPCRCRARATTWR